jgi:hypothetical protein
MRLATRGFLRIGARTLSGNFIWQARYWFHRQLPSAALSLSLSRTSRALDIVVIRCTTYPASYLVSVFMRESATTIHLTNFGAAHRMIDVFDAYDPTLSQYTNIRGLSQL